MITRRTALGGIGATLAAPLLPAPGFAAPAGSIVARHGRLGTRENRVVDAHGIPVVLRGASLFWSQWQPRFYNRGAIGWLRSDWHANVVRAAIAASNGGYDVDPARQTRLAEAAIDAAIAEGIYVIVDWHAHTPDPVNAVRFFRHIATKYRDVPNLIYEPYNEPLPQYGWADVLKPYHAQVIGAIRGIDPGAFVVAGTRSWSQNVDEAAADPLPFGNVAYTLHYYAATHRQSLRDKADAALARGAALFVTEYGVTHANGDVPIDAAEAQLWWNWCEANQISHLAWSISDKREASAALMPGAASRGGWRGDQLSESGRMVRSWIRSRQ
jgi:endoglucanase